MTDKVSRAKAEAVLEAVKAQHAAFLSPMTIDGVTYPPLYGDPTLVEDYDDRPGWAILWECGPDEWAFTIDGGTGEEDRVLFAEASAEFGGNVKAPERAPAKMPKGVWTEPINSYAVAIYPA